MATTHKIESAVYASAWITGRLEEMTAAYTKVNNQTMLEVLAEFKEMSDTVSLTLDELIVENRELTNKLVSARNALL